jgi:hypothetical protein
VFLCGSSRFSHLPQRPAVVLAAPPAIADTNEAVKFDPARMWECPQADGSSIYTNKERAGCKLLALKELSSCPFVGPDADVSVALCCDPSSDMHTPWIRAFAGDRQFRDGLRTGIQALPRPADRYKPRCARSMANGSISSKKPVAGFSMGRIRLTVET